VLGLASNGLHSNGYSLVRKIVFERGRLKIDAQVPELGETVGEALLRPTRIYVQPVLETLWKDRDKAPIRGMAHITGGGLAGNLERILPETCRVEIDRSAWQPPAVFGWLQQLGHVDREEMFRVFNMGIGYVVVVRPRDVVRIQRRLSKHRISSSIIGSVARGERAAVYVN
jgi:phosphoribosylformylglycinamidine cyclo-ligase